MPNRVIKDSIKCSKQIDSLTWFQEVMFYRLLVTADDYGRYYSNPQIIKSELFPMKEDLTKQTVVEGLDRLESVGLIRRYIVNEVEYLEIVKWLSHQQKRATKSKFPDRPQISSDNNCNQLISSDNNCNQMFPNSKSNTNTNTNTESAGARVREESFFESDEDARRIQSDHEEICQRMEYVGFDMSMATIDRVIAYYADVGKEIVLKAIDECAGVEGNKLRYLVKVIENWGKPKPDKDSDCGRKYMDEAEEREILAKLIV